MMNETFFYMYQKKKEKSVIRGESKNETNEICIS